MHGLDIQYLNILGVGEFFFQVLIRERRGTNHGCVSAPPPTPPALSRWTEGTATHRYVLEATRISK